ncbi:hypothetical protein C8R47DRAFT_1024602 [Mycena vitilis]|nr:hypothetical protein C8R47DRAFT_1024602 [Mycena vitilis]
MGSPKMEATTKPPGSQSPFNHPAADIILRSSDNIDFRAHRLVLALASPIFEHMFASAQPESQPEVPTVQMAESGAVLERILRFWYPGTEPVVENLDQLHEILELLIQKYDMQYIVPLGKQYLGGYIEAEPLGCFAVAVSRDWHDFALLAARQCLKLPLRTSSYIAPAPLRSLSAAALHSLLQYHFQCGDVARKAATNWTWMNSSESPAWLKAANPHCKCPHTLKAFAPPFAQNWVIELLAALAARVAIIPMGGRDCPGIIRKAMREAESCPTCKNLASDISEWILSHWWPKVDADIAKVELKL